jgi:hypothetical protein
MSELVAAVAADRNIAIRFFKAVPTKMNARGQTMLTKHLLSGAYIEDSF